MDGSIVSIVSLESENKSCASVKTPDIDSGENVPSGIKGRKRNDNQHNNTVCSIRRFAFCSNSILNNLTFFVGE